MACGTGACAAVVAARIAGFVDDCVSVELPGGSLTIEWDGNPDSQVYMTGPATHRLRRPAPHELDRPAVPDST